MAQSRAQTLPDVLQGSRGELFFHLKEGVVHLTADELAARAKAAAGALVERGIRPGDRVGLLGPNRPEWAIWAYGVWFAGGALVPLSYPTRIRDSAAFAEQVSSFVTAADCRLVVGAPRLLSHLGDGGMSWAEQPEDTPRDLPRPSADDLAVINMTSGSTATPKAIPRSHGFMTSAAENLMALLNIDPDRDVTVNWAPLFFGGGLWTLYTPFIFNFTNHAMPAEDFARDPVEWFRVIGRARGTWTVGPSSAWDAAMRAAAKEDGPLDVSGLRVGVLIGESIDPDAIDRITGTGRHFGLRPEALIAAYGSTDGGGISSTPASDPIRIDSVDPEGMAKGRAVPATGDPRRRIASCGRPMPGVEIWIVGADGDLPERHIGEVAVRSPNVISGYLNKDGPSPLVDGWFFTGDLGYLADGELYITGRAKEMFILMGRNYYPEDFEQVAGRLDGVQDGRCVAFARSGKDADIVLVVEPTGTTVADDLPLSVRNAVANAIGVTPADVVVVPPGTIPQTDSGKVWRRAMRETYVSGGLDDVAVGRLATAREVTR